MVPRKCWTGVLGGALAVTILALAACGSEGDGDDAGGVATIPASATADASATTAPGADGSDSGDAEAPTDRNAAFVLYDNCMAEQGFPTDAAGAADDGPVVHSQSASASGDEGPVAVGPGGVAIDPDDMDAFQAANTVCQEHLANVQGEADLSPEQQAAMDDALLKVQQCMADKGFDVQLDIGSGGSGGTVNVEDEGESAPPPNVGEVDQAAIDGAMRECSKVFDDDPILQDVPRPGGR
jgi:hypothetical protein